MRVFRILIFLGFLANEALAMWQEGEPLQQESGRVDRRGKRSVEGRASPAKQKGKKAKYVPYRGPLGFYYPSGGAAEEKRRAEEESRRKMKALLMRNQTYPVYDPSLADETEVEKERAVGIQRKICDVKLNILKKVIAEKRLEEVRLFEGGAKETAYLRCEKVIKPTIGALCFDLPDLCEKEPNPEDLEGRIKEIFDRKIESTFFYVDLRTGKRKTRTHISSFFIAQRAVVGGDMAGIRGYFTKEAKWDGGADQWIAGGSYAQNQMGRRLERFLSFFEQRIDAYDGIPRGQEKICERQKLNRLAECLRSFEERCIDRAFSALDEMDKLMVVIDDPVLMQPLEGISEKDFLEKEEKLMGLALHDYKKFLLAAFSETVEARSETQGQYNESREAYLRYMLLTQKSFGLGERIKEMYYRGHFRSRHAKPFYDIVRYVVSQMSIESFLHFISATTTVPDELRQWDYHAFVGEKTNFDETIDAQWGLWEAGKAEGLWEQVETGKNQDPFLKAFYAAELRGIEDVRSAVYQEMFAQKVKSEARDALQRLGYLSPDPYYREPLSYGLLYG